MPQEPLGLLSLLPPLVSIGTALISKQLLVSLFLGLWLGYIVIRHGEILLGLISTVESLIKLFESNENTKIMLFCLMVGGLISLTDRAKGTDGFVNWVETRGYFKSKRSALLLAWITGLIVFVETSISCLVVGSVSRPLFKKYKLSREKLAYLCDTTSAPVSVLLPFNGWGAFIVGLLLAQGINEPFSHLIQSTFYNFYPIISILLALILIITGRDFGPMRAAEDREKNKAHDPFESDIKDPTLLPYNAPKMRYLLIPIGTMVFFMPIILLITGHGNFMKGSGSSAVFWSVLIAILVSTVLYRIEKVMSFEESIDVCFKGMGNLLPLTTIVLLSFALGDICKILGTGQYLAHISKSWMIPSLIPVTLFLIGCLISFATGTSWGTFAIMIPISVPLATEFHLNLHLILGATLSGGIFGDHCSPISDTTIVASVASQCGVMEHTQTQLPYGFMALVFSALLFVVMGFIL